MLQNSAFPDSIIQVSYPKLGAKKPFLQYGAVGFQPKMISRCTVYSETKGSAPIPTGGGVFQLQTEKQLNLGSAFS